MTTIFKHTDAEVTLDGVTFFADSAERHLEDLRVGNMLCGFAFAAGMLAGAVERELGAAGCELLETDPFACAVCGDDCCGADK